jgi:hypothetical protein
VTRDINNNNNNNFIIITIIIIVVLKKQYILTRAAVYPTLYEHESGTLTQKSSLILLYILKTKLAK